MKTKFIRVAKSGKTVDGREITPAQIDQMAASYDPAKYGARIWVEHYRSMLPDGPFKAYGDVLSVKAETDADGSRVLLAQVDATQDLVNLAASRQKVFWSIEMDPFFAGGTDAYLVGLSVTDSPASLGTEMLTFAVKAADAKPALKNHLFSAYVEAAFAAEDVQTQPEAGFLAKMREIFSGAGANAGKSDDAAITAGFARLEAAFLAMAESFAHRTVVDPIVLTGNQTPEEIKQVLAALAARDPVTLTSGVVPQPASPEVAALKSTIDTLVETLSKTSPNKGRQPVSGGQSQNTDC